MKKVKSRVKMSISLDKNMKEYLEENFQNKSKYIEYLVYKDLIDNNVINEKDYYIL